MQYQRNECSSEGGEMPSLLQREDSQMVARLCQSLSIANQQSDSQRLAMDICCRVQLTLVEVGHAEIIQSLRNGAPATHHPVSRDRTREFALGFAESPGLKEYDPEAVLKVPAPSLRQPHVVEQPSEAPLGSREILCRELDGGQPHLLRQPSSVVRGHSQTPTRFSWRIAALTGKEPPEQIHGLNSVRGKHTSAEPPRGGQRMDQVVDQWAGWLRHRTEHGDDETRVARQRQLNSRRDRILDHARLRPGDVVLDLGCGDGLVALGALSREPTCRAILYDISRDVLSDARSHAEQLGLVQRCSFVQATAERLSCIADESVDVVTICTLLIHIRNKAACFTEAFRVLRPDGRLSLFEPVNRVGYPSPPETFWGYDVAPVSVIAGKLRAFYERRIAPDSDPMVDFDERDLVGYAIAAGFSDIRLDYRLLVSPRRPELTWDLFLDMQWNPRAPSLADAMREVLSDEEAAALTAHIRPLVEAGQGSRRSAIAYLSALR
jgi:ubiquinone/menaquinone biosynthesis C-methylase UbiE